MSDKAKTVSDRAVRKAGRERLLRDMREAAKDVERLQIFALRPKFYLLALARNESRRTRYACLMTAFGQ